MKTFSFTVGDAIEIKDDSIVRARYSIEGDSLYYVGFKGDILFRRSNAQSYKKLINTMPKTLNIDEENEVYNLVSTNSGVSLLTKFKHINIDCSVRNMRKSGESEASISVEGETIGSLSIDQSILTLNGNNYAKLVNLESRKVFGIIGNYKDSDNFMLHYGPAETCISADKKYIALGYDIGDIGFIELWDLKKIILIKKFTAHNGAITKLKFAIDDSMLISSSLDGTVKYWPLRGTTIGSDFVAFATHKNWIDWIVYTNDGYWDGSPDCNDLIAMVRGLECWNIDQFAARNNRPDIILERIGALPEVVSELKAAWQKRLRRLGLNEADLTTDYRVPSSAIISTKSEIQTQNGKFVDLFLQFTANGKTLKLYQVYVNDVPLFGVMGKPLSGTSSAITERIELIQGENKIEVSCMDSGGAESFRANRILSWAGNVTPNLYFLAFGVSEYTDPAIHDLKYASKDVLSLEALYKDMEGTGYGKVFTQVYTNAQVTKKSIAEAKTFLIDSKPDDTFVIFISGHGIQIRDGSKPAGAQTEENKSLPVAGTSPDGILGGSTYYYVTADARLADLPGTAVDFESIEEILQGIAPRQKLFLMDTCESGEVDESSPRIALSGIDKGLYARTIAPFEFINAAVPSLSVAQVSSQRDRYIYNDLVRRSGSIVFSSSRGNEASLEADKWQQGAFTYSILQAMKDPSADKDKNGIISTDELRSFVIDSVPVLVQTIDPAAQQHPTVDRDNIFSKFGFPTVKSQ